MNLQSSTGGKVSLTIVGTVVLTAASMLQIVLSMMGKAEVAAEVEARKSVLAEHAVTLVTGLVTIAGMVTAIYGKARSNRIQDRMVDGQIRVMKGDDAAMDRLVSDLFPEAQRATAVGRSDGAA